MKTKIGRALCSISTLLEDFKETIQVPSELISVENNFCKEKEKKKTPNRIHNPIEYSS